MGVIAGALFRAGINRHPKSQILVADPAVGPGELQTAVDKAVSQQGDFIVVLPGSWNVTETVTFDKRGLTVVAADLGMAQVGERFAISAAAAFTDGPVATVKEPTRFVNLGFTGRNTAGPSVLVEGDSFGGFNGAFSLFEDCRFQNWVGTDSAVQLVMGDFNTFVGCTFDGGTAGFGTAAILVTGSQAEGVSRPRVLSCQFSGVGNGKHAIKHDTTGGPHGLLYAHNYMDRGQTPTTDAIGKFLDNDSNTSHGLIADNWLGGMADTAAAFENLTNANLKFADNHYEEA
jgi:hypothetical protein